MVTMAVGDEANLSTQGLFFFFKISFAVWLSKTIGELTPAKQWYMTS